ncbi:MAG: RNA polymerase sigma factor [Myxococcales bacterium]|nr:RNA polymerase sigma factor [Myxococcales bacterium]
MAVPVVGAFELDETALVALAREGDAGARERLYRMHLAGLSRRVRFLVRDAAEAEDLVQETFAAAFHSLWRFRGEASFATWLHRIALNLARHHWRSRARARALQRAFSWFVSAAGDPSPRPDGDAGADEDLRVAERAIAELSPKLREAFVLLVVEELSGEEAARLAGVKVEVLRVRATRARQQVQQALRAAHGEETAS